MAKNFKKEEPQEQSEVLQSPDMVQVEAIRQVNTTLFGNLYPGEKNRKMIDRLLAVQLEKLGEVKIIG